MSFWSLKTKIGLETGRSLVKRLKAPSSPAGLVLVAAHMTLYTYVHVLNDAQQFVDAGLRVKQLKEPSSSAELVLV